MLTTATSQVSGQAKKEKAKAKASAKLDRKKAQRQAAYELDLAAAQQLQLQHPELSISAAIQIHQGQYTFEQWLAGRAKKAQKSSARRERFAHVVMEYERGWLNRRAFHGEPVVLQMLGGQPAQVSRLGYPDRFTLPIRNEEGTVSKLDKLDVAAIFREADAASWATREKTFEELAGAQIAVSRSRQERKPFPQDVLSDCIGKPVVVVLLNGLQLEGQVEWDQTYTFLLSADGAEVLVFKHGVWSLSAC